MIIRKYTEKDISEMVRIWNEVVEDGEAFPQEDMQWIQLAVESISVRNL